MGSTLKYAPQQWSDDSDDSQPSDAERSDRAVAAEDVFDDPSILDELAEANASLTERSFAPARPLPTRLPPVDAFDLDEACRTDEFEEASRAKSLAHRLGPPAYDEPKPRRWRRGLGKFAQRQPVVTTAAPRGKRGAFFWGFCTSLAIIVAVPTVFGFVLPLSSSPPAAIGSGVEAGASTADERASPAATEIAADERPANQTIAIRKQPVAAGMIAPATTAFAAPLGPSTAPAPDEGFRPSAAPPEATAEEPAPVIDLNTRATKLEAVVVEISTPNAEPEAVNAEVAAATETATAAVTPPAVAPEPPVAQADDADAVPPAEIAAPSSADAEVDFTRMAQSQLSSRTDPSATGGVDPEPDPRTSTGQPASNEEVDRLLARGEALLRNGNIVSARMLFLHIAAAGDARGAKAVGMTYDPEVYARLPVTGLTPDRAQAEIWYEKAGGETAYTIDLTQPQAAAPVDEDALALKERHAACERKYVSYDRSTGLYLSRSGSKKPCQLP